MPPYPQRPQIPPVNVTSISGLAAVSKDTPVFSVIGTIGNLGRRNEGTGKWGPYSFQDAVISDASGSFKMTFGNLPDQAHLNGQTVTISLNQQNKGVTVVEKEDFRSHQMEKLLRVDGKTAIIQSGGSPTPDAVHHSAPVAAPQPAAPSGTPATREDVEIARRELSKQANLMFLCSLAADFYESKRMDETGEKPAGDSHQKTTACLFIEANKRGLGVRMPIDDIQGYIPTTAGA